MKTSMFLTSAIIGATACLSGTPAYAMTANTATDSPPKINLQELNASAADLSLMVLNACDGCTFVSINVDEDAPGAMLTLISDDTVKSDDMIEDGAIFAQGFGLAMNVDDTGGLRHFEASADTADVHLKATAAITDDAALAKTAGHRNADASFDLANAVHGEPLSPMLATESPQGGPLGAKNVVRFSALPDGYKIEENGGTPYVSAALASVNPGRLLVSDFRRAA